MMKNSKTIIKLIRLVVAILTAVSTFYAADVTLSGSLSQYLFG